MIRIRPVTQQVLGVLEERMNADDHSMLCQTHVVYQERDIIGSASLGVLPFCSFWMDSKKSKIRDTLQAIQSYESILADRARLNQNLPVVIVPVSKESPLFPYVTKLGYRQLKSMELFIKEL